jgi:alpha-glucosidase (family GH31 glycosyl hydrolase)
VPGGAVVTTDAPLERIPIFLRDRARLDIGVFTNQD